MSICIVPAQRRTWPQLPATSLRTVCAAISAGTGRRTVTPSGACSESVSQRADGFPRRTGAWCSTPGRRDESLGYSLSPSGLECFHSTRLELRSRDHGFHGWEKISDHSLGNESIRSAAVPSFPSAVPSASSVVLSVSFLTDKHCRTCPCAKSAIQAKFRPPPRPERFPNFFRNFRRL